MELRELRYFLALVQEQNFSKAAEVLHTTQPNLSRQIQNIEEEIGQKLIIRGNRQITLTDAGITLRKRAQEILELYEKTEAELKFEPDEVSGVLNIGGGETYITKYLTDKIKEINDLYPRITFSVTSSDTQTALEDLDKGLIDLAIVVEPALLTRYNYIRLPGYDTWGILMRKDSPLAKKDSIKAEDLENLPLIISRHILREKSFMNWFKNDINSLNIVGNYNLFYNAILMVESGLGYALTFDSISKNVGDDLVFKPLNPLVTTHVDIAYKKYQRYPKHLEYFIELLKEGLN